MQFINREEELALLRDHLDRPGAGMFVLYGRRRIGKTALLQKVLAGIPDAAYHVGTRSTITEELGRLSATLATAWRMPLLQQQPLASSAAFMALLEGLERPAVLVLDELPFLVDSDPSLPGLMQSTWDRSLASGSLKLVFCGSSIGIMRDTFLSKRAPLFGRRTGQLSLGPLQPHHLHAAFPWRPPELLELAAVFGGVPGYLQRLDPGRSLIENLRSKVLQRGEPLYEEVPFLLREELREPRVYNAVLAVIAGGAQKFGEISSKVGLDRANLSRYLSILIDLGLVRREVPVTEHMPEKSRKGLYSIADPFVAAWFAFVHPNRDLLEQGRVGEVVKTLRPRLGRWLSLAVEPVVCELLQSPVLSHIVPFRTAVAGRYWSPSAELDAVLLDQDRGRAFVAEIKWGRKPVSPGLLDALRRRVEGEAAFSEMSCTFAVISRSGFSCNRTLAEDERLVDVSALEW